MQVLVVNGSPHPHGCTFTALEEVAKTLSEEGVSVERFWIGAKPISGCLGCGKCKELGRCVIDDGVNPFVQLASTMDGFVFGTPVHYAAMCGGMTAFMDRVFYSEQRSGLNAFYLKPAAGVLSARRAGTTAAFDQINKYFTISQMPVISSQYWNMVHGSQPQEVLQDLEGLQIMRTLARNMAWFLKCKQAGAQNGVPLPKREESQRTNFIRASS